MLKISSRWSVKLSIALSIIFFVIITAGATLMPLITKFIARNVPGEHNQIIILVLAYIGVVFIALADILLFKLLRRVQKELVFTKTSVSLIRGISWCAIGLGFTLFALGRYFALSLVVAFACGFLGLCIRVVKNVIEQATEIKSEHDYTI